MPSAKRPNSMELRAIRDQLRESPPPAPSGTSVREWFAGLALANPILMKGISADLRAKEAVRLADELITALSAPRIPTLESLAPPTELQMVEWEKRIALEQEKRLRQTRDTVPSLKCTHRARSPKSFPEETRYFLREDDIAAEKPTIVDANRPGRSSTPTTNPR